MPDTLFGSTIVPMWPAIPAGVGWMPHPLSMGTRPLGGIAPATPPFTAGAGGISASTTEPYPINGGLLPPPLMPSFFPPVAPSPFGAIPLAPPGGAEIGLGAAPALLAAVAMRRGQPQGPTNDQEIEDFLCDALDLLPGANDVEVRCEGGRAVLTGSVPHKRLKRDAGEIAWSLPGVSDVQNNVTIAQRRRTRSQRDTEPATTPGAVGRKQT